MLRSAPLPPEQPLQCGTSFSTWRIAAQSKGLGAVMRMREGGRRGEVKSVGGEKFLRRRTHHGFERGWVGGWKGG